MNSSSSSSNLFNSRCPQSLLKLGIRPPVKSLNLFLVYLFKSQKLSLIPHIFSQISSSSIALDAGTHSVSIHAALKSKNFHLAEELISNYPKNHNFTPRNSLFDSLIRGISNVEQDPERALRLLRDCVEKHGFLPSVKTFRLLILSLCSKGEMDIAVELLEMMKGEKFAYPVDNLVCSSIISGFCRNGKPNMGVEFYNKLEKSCELELNLVTHTAVLGALCKQGKLDEASNLVAKMEDKRIDLDSVLYSAWINGYFKVGDLIEGLRKHTKMVQNSVEPDLISYTVLIDGFCRLGIVEKVIGILNEMEKSGLRPNLLTCTAIIRGFCSKGKMEEAFMVFETIKELGLGADEFVYATLMDGLCKLGEMDRTFELLKEMEREGINAGNVTYNTIINGLCKNGKTFDAVEVSKKFDGDNFTYSTLLHGYVTEEDVGGVIQVKKRLEKAGILMDVVTLNVLMKALFMAGMVNDACKLFEEMLEMGLVANYITYSTMIDGLCKLGMMEKAMDIFNVYKRSMEVSGTACHNTVIIGLCKGRKIAMANDVFHHLLVQNLVPSSSLYRKLIKANFGEHNGEGVLKFLYSIEQTENESLSYIFNYALCFFCLQASFQAALNVYMLIRWKRLPVSSKAFYVLLKGLFSDGNKELGQLIMGQYVRLYGCSDSWVVNIIYLFLCKKNIQQAIQYLSKKGEINISCGALKAIILSLKDEGRVQDALKFLILAVEKGMVVNIVHYSIVVDGLCKEGYLEKALDLCARMQGKGIDPNIVLYNSIINGLCQQGCLTEAFRLFDSLQHNNVIPNVVTYSTLIDALCREGFLEDAYQLFERMSLKGVSPNTHIWNSLINRYCCLGLIEEALKLLSDMERSCLEADSFTISSFITGYCLKGDMEGALGFFNKFKGKGIHPDFFGYLNLTKGLFAKGRMEEARTILRDLLQCETMIDMINRLGNEHYDDSLGSLLLRACEHGKIKEVILVLNQIGSINFSKKVANNHSRLTQISKLDDTCSFDIDSEIDSGIQTMVVLDPSKIYGSFASTYLAADKVDTMKNKDSGFDEPQQFKSLDSDFDTYYSALSSLCSKGEVSKANHIVAAMLVNSGGKL